MAQDKTSNYQFALPNPVGIQIAEMQKVADSIIAIDAKLKASETALSTHRHSFADLLDKPTTLEGYGITDGMTAAEIAAAIKAAIDGVVNGSGAALDTLKELADALGNDPQFATTVSNALGVRVRVDAAQSFSLAQKAQGRGNLDALGTVDKGKANGVASLDGSGKVPAAQLPAMDYLSSAGGRLKGTVKVQVADTNGAVALVSGDASHTGYIEGWLPNGKRGWYLGWAAADNRVIMSAENGLKGFEVVGDFKTSMGFESYGNGSTRGIFRNTGAGDSWIQFFANDAPGWYAEFGLRASGAAYIWANGHEFRFQTNGQFWSAGDVVARGVVHAGSGAARLETNGNIVGNIWANYGHGPDAYTAITNRMEDRSAAWARQEAGYRARKCAGWDQWNFTSHDQRMQNNTGENIYYTATVSGGNSGVYLQISPDNGTYWTIGAPLWVSNVGYSQQYTGGCLPPGWWMRIIRSSGSYNANVILIW